MKARCPDCRGRGHVGGYSRVCKGCNGSGVIMRPDIVPEPTHGTTATYDDGCRCGPCVAFAARTAADTPLGRELGLGDPLPDRPDDQDLPRWMTDAHDRCEAAKVDRTGAGTVLEWPCGARTILYAEAVPLTAEEWHYRHDLTLTALEAMRQQTT